LFFRPGSVNLILLQGNCISAIKRARRQKTIVIGEAVNIHPKKLKSVLDTDAQYHGVKTPLSQRLFEKKIAEIDLIDFLLVPSKAVADSYVEHGFGPERIIVIPYGSEVDVPMLGSNDATVTRKVAGPLKPMRIVCVGQLSPRKGQLHLLLALKQSKKIIDFEITFIGFANGAYLDALRETKVPFEHIEYIKHDDIVRAIAKYDVFCLNSIEDGFGMVVTEALSAGIPVAVSRYAGASEIVESCGGGVTYDPWDYDAVASALVLCATGQSPPVHKKVGTWDDYAEELIKSVGSLVERRNIVS
jgi:glycosyltransferase involved in cell wall biosynthesis